MSEVKSNSGRCAEGEMNGDTYKRREVSPGVYQCGCQWNRWEGGDILRQCPLHQAHTADSVRRFDAERQRKLAARATHREDANRV